MGRRQAETKAEYAARMRQYRKAHPEYAEAGRQDRRDVMREKKAQLVAYKGGKCTDCSGVFPNCCFQFDHRDPEEKSFRIARSHRAGFSIEALKMEANKCDLVCANCHAIRTFGNAKVAQKISKGRRNALLR